MNCAICKKELNKKQKKYCSVECRTTGRRVKVEEKFCLYCSKQLIRQQILVKQIYCSKKCKDLHQTKNYKKRNCEICGKELLKKQLQQKQKFCSTNCRGTAQSIRQTGKNNPMYGKDFSAEHRKKISKNVSKALTGKKRKPFSKEWKENIRKSLTGRKHTEETKKKQRISHLNQIQKNNGILFPNYNIKACEYFKKFDEENNTQGRYAVYGGGEYCIKKLGYYPDYINFDTKLIMEWDEKRHYKNGDLKEKDLARQQEIQKHFLNFEFIRVRENEI